MSARGPAGPLSALGGGLLLIGGVVGDWITRASVREVGGVRIPGQVGVSGTEFAAPALALAVGAMLLGLVAMAVPPARRVAGLLLSAAGLLAVAVVGWGVAAAAGRDGDLAATPVAAALGAGTLIWAGNALRTRSPGASPALDERYTVEGAAAEDAEWELAAEEPPESAS